MFKRSTICPPTDGTEIQISTCIIQTVSLTAMWDKGLFLLESPNGTSLKYAVTVFASTEKLTTLSLPPSLKILHSIRPCGGRSYACKPLMAPFFVTHPKSLFKNQFCPLFLSLDAPRLKKHYPSWTKIDLFWFKPRRKTTCATRRIHKHTYLYVLFHPCCQMFRLRSMNQSPTDERSDGDIRVTR